MIDNLLIPNHGFKSWRTTLILGLTLLAGLFTISCEKGDVGITADEYYVKYEINSTTIYSGGKIDLTITTEKNIDLTLVINQQALHETIIGPVEKGFNASMNAIAQGNTNDRLNLYATIYVSKNGSPFALKEHDGTDVPRDSVQLTYTIDY